MSNRDLIEQLVPDFLDVEVESTNDERERVEEVVVVSARHDGERYESTMVFEDTNGELSDLKRHEATALLTRVVEAAMEDTQVDEV